ncbi:hypothetical protein V6N13_107003 [Hibiscus sabdariffa]|uniref:Uncharacterized protein n=1 Tax=Hibiscus sabdariffa TaxID=183260 RepID=A0ABR2F2G4_9ROSI
MEPIVVEDLGSDKVLQEAHVVAKDIVLPAFSTLNSDNHKVVCVVEKSELANVKGGNRSMYGPIRISSSKAAHHNSRSNKGLVQKGVKFWKEEENDIEATRLANRIHKLDQDLSNAAPREEDVSGFVSPSKLVGEDMVMWRENLAFDDKSGTDSHV